MNRKMIAILLSACTCLAFPAASMAAETDTASSQSISVTLTAEPEYTITIPESVSMGNDGTTVNVTASDVQNLPEGKKINPMIGAAGISAFPMSGRVVNQMGLKEDNQNFLLMYSVSVNVSGQIASVIAGGLILTLMGV